MVSSLQMVNSGSTFFLWDKEKEKEIKEVGRGNLHKENNEYLCAKCRKIIEKK